MSALRDAALQYAALGWRVLPLAGVHGGTCDCGKFDCASPGKHPFIGTGFKAASASQEQVADWWDEFPEANVGIATGEVSGIWVLDVDGELGESSLASLEQQHGPLPPTLTVATGNGRHHYFTCKTPLPSRVGVRPGLDVRAEKGYVVAPPSRHASGSIYTWSAGAPAATAALPEAPAWLIELVCKPPTPPILQGSAPSPASGGAVVGFPEGSRNYSLYRLACSYRAKNFDEATARELILAQAKACQPPLPEAEALKCFASAWKNAPGSTLDDVGNARRLVCLLAGSARYVREQQTWLVRTGARWRRDADDAVENAAKRLSTVIKEQAAETANSDYARELVRWARKSGSRAAIRAAIALARTEPGISVSAAELDVDDDLLGVTNGVLHLHRRRLVDSPESIVTRAARVDFDANATAPRWAKFVAEILGGDPDLIAFVQRAVGYSLTGAVSEQVIFVVTGSGANGKSTFMGVLLDLLGDYAVSVPAPAILAGRDRDYVALADLEGARLAAVPEVPEDCRLNEPLLKALSGGDMMKARRLYRDYREFSPSTKLWLVANGLPEVRDTGYAFWRRLRVIPFNHQVPAAAQDPRLREALLAEAPGILNWALDGLEAWRTIRLQAPPAVLSATGRYQAENDVVAAWISARCSSDPGAEVESRVLYADYSEWSSEQGLCIVSGARFGRRLALVPGVGKRSSSGKTLYRGLRLQPLYTPPGHQGQGSAPALG